jgi:hypothetical protein
MPLTTTQSERLSTRAIRSIPFRPNVPIAVTVRYARLSQTVELASPLRQYEGEPVPPSRDGNKWQLVGANFRYCIGPAKSFDSHRFGEITRLVDVGPQGKCCVVRK